MPTCSRGGARAALIPLLLAAVAVFVAATPASATTFSVPVAADAYVSAAAPSSAYGAAATLKVDGDPRLRTYLRFDVGGLDGPVSRATLSLTSANTSTTGVTAHAVASTTWDERTITWSTQPGLGAQVATSGPFSGTSPVRLDVTPLVAGNGAVSIGIATSSTSSKTFDSRESGLRPPVLTIETTPPAPAPEPAPSGDVLIAAVGDIACDPAGADFLGGFGQPWACRQMATSDLALARRPAAVLPLGDEQYEHGTLSAFGGSYDPSWGRLRSISRPVPGNHEYGTAGAAGYFAYFGAAAGDPARGYYSYDLGAWHLVALNSTCWAAGGCWAGSPQEQWLRADLAATSRSCVLAYWHHPTFTSATRGGLAETLPLYQALQDGGAEVLLTGHEHLYERFARQDVTGRADRANGIRQFTIGTGGRSLHAAPPTRAANSGFLDDRHFGVGFFTLRAGGYDWRYETTDGVVGDSGSDTCSGSPPDTAPPTAPTELRAALDGAGARLSWNASTDDDGVASYVVRRDGVTISTPTTNAAFDTGIKAGTTHRYEVLAVDAAGNRSTAAAVSLTVPSTGVLAVPVAADATLLRDSPLATGGTSTRIEIDNSPVKHALLRVDVQGLNGRAVRRAVLRLHCIDPSGFGGRFERTSATWLEDTVSWSTAPLGSGTVVASLGAVAAGAWYEVDLTGVITGDGTYAFRLSSTSSDGADYVSSEGQTELRPSLLVEPA